MTLSSSLPEPSVLIGSAGMGLLLVAFFASLFGRMDPRGSTYTALNAIGAALSCAASAMIQYIPFVVLEATCGRRRDRRPDPLAANSAVGKDPEPRPCTFARTSAGTLSGFLLAFFAPATEDRTK